MGHAHPEGEDQLGGKDAIHFPYEAAAKVRVGEAVATPLRDQRDARVLLLKAHFSHHDRSVPRRPRRTPFVGTRVRPRTARRPPRSIRGMRTPHAGAAVLAVGYCILLRIGQ